MLGAPREHKPSDTIDRNRRLTNTGIEAISGERSVFTLNFDWIVGIGASSLGAVIGWMAVRTFLSQAVPTVKVFGSIVSVLVGGGVLGFFRSLAPESSSIRYLWLYPVGLLIGVLVPEIWRIQSRIASQMNTSARESLLAYLEGRGSESVSLQEARTDLSTDEEDLRGTIVLYSNLFAILRLPDGTPGVGLRKKN